MANVAKLTSREPKHGRAIRTFAGLTTAAGILLFTVSQATPPAGVVSNVMLAQGATAVPLAEKISVGGWTLHLEDKGQSEFYFQDLVLAPSGRTGWHAHPGLLLITIKEGSVEWYDHNCGKRTYAAGQSFTEAAEPHNVVNPGPGNAHLLIAYIVKKGEPRRSESEQPKCAEALGVQ
jgi:quercetin dioxygenase-like cupin family protein